MCFVFEIDIGFDAGDLALSSASKTLMHYRLALGKRNLQTCLIKSASLIPSAIATYSALDVERVMHFCVLENQLTAVPPHITTPPEADLVSVALLVKSEFSNTSN